MQGTGASRKADPSAESSVSRMRPVLVHRGSGKRKNGENDFFSTEGLTVLKECVILLADLNDEC